MSEIALPELFNHYTTTLDRAEGYLNVNVLGGIAPLDQEKLIGMGWTKVSDSTFFIES